MTRVHDALTDYLQLRRRLGFAMPQDARLLEGFVTFLEQASAERIATDLALAWARLPEQAHPSHWRQRLSVVRGVRASPGDARPGQRGPAVDLGPSYATTRRPGGM
jgi:hypothetical protein